MKTLKVSRVIDVPLSITWKVISDVAGYAQYAPNIQTSTIVSGQGVGMIRECTSTEGRWQEQCTRWQENHLYSFQVQTQAKDYPYPFSVLNAEWSVKTRNPTCSIMTLNIEVEFKNTFLGWALFPVLKRKYLKICNELMDNWEEKALSDQQYAKILDA